ncbi:phosphoribosylglycinamide synthetase [Neisseria musculi]|uniref:Uncharacterized protein n=1 Tax=Neisseria musculi TaxID=1815583 RepID=A0A7H1ME72_9NEIS|nr:phosphoribosylglycinamide synthetase [Neisseria musculi]QNT59937.1 hypothetical protein H7A79_2296 [Neisseria musculi]
MHLTALAACQKEATPAAPAQAPQQAVAPTSGESLIREPVAAQSQPAQAIQTKTVGNDTIHLTKAKVVGQILNVEFVAVPPKAPDGKYDYFAGSSHKLADFDYIDKTTSKKITLLQDENGKYMADPINNTHHKEIRIPGSTRHPLTISLKFPAPPETSPTITIDFPNIGSFESVPVSR